MVRLAAYHEETKPLIAIFERKELWHHRCHALSRASADEHPQAVQLAARTITVLPFRAPLMSP